MDSFAEPERAAPAAPAAAAASASGPPLVVDLDGTLIRSDLLVESFLSLLSARPLQALRCLGALRRGKAAFKAALADHALVDAHTLPYDPAVLALVQAARAEGRSTVLASASDARYVRQVAEHLGGFDAVLGTEGDANLSGPAKADALAALYGERGFDYVGDHAVDAPVWRRARRAYVKAPGPRLRRRLQREGLVAEPVGERGARARAWLKALRPHQWLKNALVFLPPLAGHAFGAPLLACVAAFVAFSLCASSVYLLNDLLDLRADREHARKRRRPFASGDAPLLQGLLLAPLLLIGAVAIGVFLPPRFLLVLAGYFTLTLAYSLGLKRIVMIDVVTLACLYGARLLAGSAASDVPLSHWLEALSVFLFLSLALVKRSAELVDRIQAGKGDPSGRDYRLSDLPMVEAMGAAAGFTAVLVLALYLNSPDVDALYRRSHRLWLICVVVLYWVCRMLMKAHRGEMHDDPVVFAVRDRASLVCGAVCAAVVASAL
ncbi:MAG: UbiA family prenyltransferase [Caulobacteraceae bacterium]|nr:UbiA family prenyltransferase [Caulobacter sp.]